MFKKKSEDFNELLNKKGNALDRQMAVGQVTCSSAALVSFLLCACVCVSLMCSSSIDVRLKRSLNLTCQLKSVSNNTLPVVLLLLPASPPHKPSEPLLLQ